MHGNGQRLLGEFEWRAGVSVPKGTRRKRNSSSVDHLLPQVIQIFFNFLEFFFRATNGARDLSRRNPAPE
jgi:hypothetical protein